METLIEFTHRATSGVALIAVVALFVWARRDYPERHPARFGAALSLVFIVLEALLGAGLVLFELVAYDESRLRAVSMVAHLVNTFLLVGALTLTAWWASGGGRLRVSGSGARGVALAAGLLGLLLVGASGAIAALGDTLYPSESLVEGLRSSFSAESQPLIQLRKYHPLFAILVGLFIVSMARRLARTGRASTIRLANLLTGLYVAQVLAGTINIVLLAPVALQLLHLALADGVWIGLVLLTAATLSEQREELEEMEEGDGATDTAHGEPLPSGR